jgi:hypothetical protein
MENGNTKTVHNVKLLFPINTNVCGLRRQAHRGHLTVRQNKYTTDYFKLLNTKRSPLYLKAQLVPRFKHLSTRLEKQPAYTVSDTSLCLSSDKYKIHKYGVGRAYDS